MSAKRQIGEAEKQQVLARQGPYCIIDHHPVDDPLAMEFDHIHPFSQGGESTVANIGAVCKKHNREKGTLSLSEYRDRIDLGRFFEGAKKRRLNDLLEFRLGKTSFAAELATEWGGGSIKLYLEEGPLEVPLQICPATGERYFFALLPSRHLMNDTELQPRALEPERLWELYRHLRTHTQLAPSVARLVGNQVLLFDGQHKAAAQFWAGRHHVDCKIYLDPNVRRLKETNLTAHDKLRQMPFYTSTLLEKYADMAHEDWQAFLETAGPKTELAFMDFMRAKVNLTRAVALKRIKSVIHRDILEHPTNAFRDYITEENRGRQDPLTIYRLEKTFFAEFVASPPLDDEFETDDYHRDEERENIVHLFNAVVAKGLDGRWNPEAADAAHHKATRIFSAGALRAWVPYLRDAIAPALQLLESDERRKIFYRELTDSDFAVLERLVARTFSHKIWEDPNPELNDLKYDNADRAKQILSKAGLTPNWILGGD